MLVLEILPEKPPYRSKDCKFRRHIYLGVRKTVPKLGHLIHAGSKMDIREYIKTDTMYPVCLVWEDPEGNKHYARVKRIKDTSKKAN